MTDGKRYVIEKTAPNTYLGEMERVINGYRVRVLLVEFDELHEFNVEDIEPETVKAKVEKLLEDREGLKSLG